MVWFGGRADFVGGGVLFFTVFKFKMTRGWRRTLPSGRSTFEPAFLFRFRRAVPNVNLLATSCRSPMLSASFSVRAQARAGYHGVAHMNGRQERRECGKMI